MANRIQAAFDPLTILDCHPKISELDIKYQVLVVVCCAIVSTELLFYFTQRVFPFTHLPFDHSLLSFCHNVCSCITDLSHLCYN